jgi:Protein of unknown function (DUF3306)
MTSPENFVSRWARLKSESDTEPKTEFVGHGSRQEAVASVGTETPSMQQQDEVVDEPFDPASLPSIETITFDTDIRGFLQSRVPAALTRAALRQAWASDPAIRDFIGIAENQWDFNDPTAMPGFGPMQETDNVPALLARALGGRDKLADMIPEIPAPVENALPPLASRELSNPDQSLQQTSERLLAADEISNLPDDSNESTTTRNDWVAEEDDYLRSYRSHGSALPR